MRFRILYLCLLSAASLPAADVSFTKQIAPLLIEKCVECHREAKAKGNYRLDTFESLMKKGDSGTMPVVAGKPANSALYSLLVTDDDADRMPKKADPLSTEEIALVKQWIADGAKFDAKEPKKLLSDISASRITVKTPAKYQRPLPVTALAVSPDQKFVATSGYGEVLLFDLAASKLAARIGGMPERIFALAWPSTGDILAVAGGTPGRAGELWLVNPTTHLPLKRILTTPDTVQSLAVSKDGKSLAVGGTDNHVRMYDLPDGKLRWDVESHADWVGSLAFSPDGTVIASGSRDRTARIYDAAKGEIKGTHAGHTAAVLCVQFSADGKLVYSGASDGEIRTWNIDSAPDAVSVARPSRDGVLRLASGGGKVYASFADKGAVEYDVKAKKVSSALTPPDLRVNDVILIEEPPTAVLGTQAGDVRIWDLKTRQEKARFAALP